MILDWFFDCMPLNLRKLSVLVVEDLAPMLDVVVDILKILGVGQVYQARDGASGFRQFVRYRPDIVLTDWEMDPVDGLELVRAIRHDATSPKRTTPIIVMTGYAAAARVAAARDLGATEFLVKPFTANELVRRITYVVEHPRDFVETADFFGPDRRRRKSDAYDGIERRKDE
jgi:DNA-binding response OmpR family regulator